MLRRKKGGYFPQTEGAPSPLVVRTKRRVRFSEADVMGIAWYGRYPAFFEDASAELGRRCGLSYRDFYEAGLMAPIAQFHIDYHRSIALDEEFSVVASAIWSEGARLNSEYALIRNDESLAATAYSIQMLIQAESGEPCLTTPELVERCRRRWKAGEFAFLQ